MFLRSLFFSVKEACLSGSNHKYKIHSLNYSSNGVDVVCELIKEGELITLKLQEVINNKLRFFESRDIITLCKIVNDKNVDTNPKQKKKYYNYITVAFSILLLLSNIAETKICNFFGYSLGAGTLVFPLLYILGDVVTEVYGFLASRKVIWVGFLSTIFYSFFMYLVCFLPPSDYWANQSSFEQIFFTSPRIVAASLLSYFVGELLNAVIISLLKLKLEGKFFAFRALFSTFVGSFVESFIFSGIAFFNRIPTTELIGMIILLTFIKVTYEIIVMPITIRCVEYLKQSEELNYSY